jgi:uncharacterized protein (TIGR02001 family)
MKTKILIAAMAAMIGMAPVARADDLISEKDLGGKFSANVGLVTEYLFRATSQSGDGNPAVQGGFDFAHNSGLYIGTWASSINFGGNIETDFYGGWSGDIGANKIGLNVGAILYHYPSASKDTKLDMWEGYVGVSKDFSVASASAKISYTPDWTGTGSTKSATYLEAAADVPAGKYFTVNLHAGHQWFEDNTGVGLDDYTDYSLGVSFGLAGFAAKVAYIDSDLSNTQLTSVFGQKHSGKLIATLSRSF